ncbi:hypothetical protein M8J77_023678 [Diaphorina citri]|nr:hypothetical protein M8J77_023678 [Diaphorina citri]
MLAKAVYEEWYFKKRDEALKKREQAVKQSKIRQWEREHNKNETKKKCQETYEEWLNKKKLQQKMEKIKASSMMNNFNKRQSHQEKAELAFHAWKKEKEIALQKKMEDKKKEKENQEEEEKERKRIEAEKAYNLWKRKTEEEMRRKKQQREKQQKEQKMREVLQVEERHRNADASFRYWKQKKEQALREQIKRSRRAKELAMETRARMRDNQLYESNHAFMEWLDMIEERLHLQNLLDEKHKCSKHPPWFPAGTRSYL